MMIATILKFHAEMAEIIEAKVSTCKKRKVPKTKCRRNFGKPCKKNSSNSDSSQIITVRTTAFEAAASGGSGEVEAAPAAGELPVNSEFVGQELSKSDRPDLASAKVSIKYCSSGLGMGLKNMEISIRRVSLIHPEMH